LWHRINIKPHSCDFWGRRNTLVMVFGLETLGQRPSLVCFCSLRNHTRVVLLLYQIQGRIQDLEKEGHLALHSGPGEPHLDLCLRSGSYYCNPCISERLYVWMWKTSFTLLNQSSSCSKIEECMRLTLYPSFTFSYHFHWYFSGAHCHFNVAWHSKCHLFQTWAMMIDNILTFIVPLNMAMKTCIPYQHQTLTTVTQCSPQLLS
jgi:hypothetical protein